MGHGRTKMIQEWNVLRYAERRRFTRVSETSCVINNGRERTCKHARISLLHTKITITLRQRLQACSSGPKRASSQDLKEHLVRTKPKIRGMIRKQRCTSRPDPDPCFSRHTKETYGADRRNYSASVHHESHIAHRATHSTSKNPDEGLTDHVPKDVMITERQFDLATQQATMYQFSLHFVDGTAELNTAFAPIRERARAIRRTQNIVANDSVRSIIQGLPPK